MNQSVLEKYYDIIEEHGIEILELDYFFRFIQRCYNVRKIVEKIVNNHDLHKIIKEIPFIVFKGKSEEEVKEKTIDYLMASKPNDSRLLDDDFNVEKIEDNFYIIIYEDIILFK